MAVIAHSLVRNLTTSGRDAGNCVRFRCDTEAELPTSNVIDGDVAYALDTKKMFDRVSGAWVEVGNASNTGGGGSLPAGLICMWHGLLSNVPSGWVLCDGGSGTPDLRSKFVKGAAAGADPGATGGAATHSHADHASHTHTYTQIVNHTHPITDPGHTHTTQRYPTSTGGSSGFTIDTSMSGTLADNTLPTKSATTGITTGNPAGGVATGTTNGPSATLVHDAVNHEPSYYAVAYIMKT